MARKKSSQVSVRWLPTLMMRSPGLIPLCSAGDPLVTTATSTGSLSKIGTWAPWARTTVISTSDRTMFITGPAIRMRKRSHLGRVMNSSAAPVCGSSGFSPAIFT